jgi:hypothetical protein
MFESFANDLLEEPIKGIIGMCVARMVRPPCSQYTFASSMVHPAANNTSRKLLLALSNMLSRLLASSSAISIASLRDLTLVSGGGQLQRVG